MSSKPTEQSTPNTDRLTPDNAALLLVDHQAGLANGINDQSVLEFRTALTALAKIGKLFDLPTVITTSAADGPNGPLLPELKAILPKAPVISRPGEINAWDNADFVAAVEKTGRKKLLIAGISTDVCVAFVALSAVKAGYEVYAVLDASGTWNKLVQEAAVARMVQAGVIPMTWVAVGAELQADWRQRTGKGLAEVMGEHLPFYGNLIASHS